MSKVIESTSSDLMQAVDSVHVATTHLTKSNDVNQTSHQDLEVAMECEDIPLMFTNEPWLKGTAGISFVYILKCIISFYQTNEQLS